MGRTVQIPKALTRLLTAKAWERAAIVYAFTSDPGQGEWSNDDQDTLTCSEFSELGIYGLTTTESVYRARRNWQGVIDAGLAVAVEPGDTVTLPDVPYPPSGTNDHSLRNSFRQNAPAAETAHAICHYLRERPEVARLVAEAWSESERTSA